MLNIYHKCVNLIHVALKSCIFHQLLFWMRRKIRPHVDIINQIRFTCKSGTMCRPGAKNVFRLKFHFKRDKLYC